MHYIFNNFESYQINNDSFTPELPYDKILNTMATDNRVQLKNLKATQHWGTAIAELIVQAFPNEEVYTCAAGITPSGIVHFGNFRDIMTCVIVAAGLRSLGKKTRIIFSWDNFDRFRKVPANVDKSFEQYIGLPVSSVPDPEGKASSYAESFELPFEAAMRDLGIALEYRRQSELFRSGAYQTGIRLALQKRERIAEILLSFMSDKSKSEKQLDEAAYKADFYPVAVYSRFTGKDSTRILSYDGANSLQYKCLETEKEDTLDLTKDNLVKPAWKIDWPMRWNHERVVFEPGGKDHASPGGSYDVSRIIAEEIYGRPAPVFVGYEFIGIQGQGSKMSGSKGNAISPSELLNIYQVELLKWLYIRRSPQHSFQLAFDTEIYRQYDEFDREVQQAQSGQLTGPALTSLEMSFDGDLKSSFEKPIPFRQAVALGQIVQWDISKVKEIVSELALGFDPRSLEPRLAKAKYWLEEYNADSIICLRDSVNQEYLSTMSAEQKAAILQLAMALQDTTQSLKKLEELVYAIPKDPALTQKENSPRQRAFFKDVYNLLVGSNEGPRLSTFLWAADREKVLGLLKTVQKNCC